MKKIYIMSALAVCLFSATACSDFLDREPDKIMTDDQIFGDAVMIKSVLANYYVKEDNRLLGRFILMFEAAFRSP